VRVELCPECREAGLCQLGPQVGIVECQERGEKRAVGENVLVEVKRQRRTKTAAERVKGRRIWCQQQHVYQRESGVMDEGEDEARQDMDRGTSRAVLRSKRIFPRQPRD